MLDLKSQTPQTAKLPPRRQKNTELRPREYLTHAEIEQLLQAARQHGRAWLSRCLFDIADVSAWSAA